MADFVSRDLMQFSITKKQMKDEKRKVIEAKTVKVLKECLWFKNYQQRNAFTTNAFTIFSNNLSKNLPFLQYCIL